MSDKFYAEIFNHNGTSYHRAMQLFPTARDEEFKSALSLLQLQAGQHLLDVPAGGGYLREYLPKSVTYSGLDFSDGFVTQGNVEQCSETLVAADDASVDVAVCLAALHHIEDKLGFFKELSRSLKPGGTLLIADIVKSSKEAKFLNDFVNDWNELGHNGDFICFDLDTRLLQDSGFSTETITKSYHWNFESNAACHKYLRLLFALNKAPSEQLLEAEIAKLGTKKTNSSFHLSWSLGFIIARAL